MREIKIGRRIFEIKSGDYILYNGACYQFCSGDKRELYFEGWTYRTSIVIPKSVLKKIDLTKLERIQTGDEKERSLLIRYYFK